MCFSFEMRPYVAREMRLLDGVSSPITLVTVLGLKTR